MHDFDIDNVSSASPLLLLMEEEILFVQKMRQQRNVVCHLAEAVLTDFEPSDF